MTSNSYRLESMQHAQCHVIIQRRSLKDVEARLISYSTLVLVAQGTPEGSVRLLCSGTYSPTTARHINRFTKEFFGMNLYHACKEATRKSDFAFELVSEYPFTSAEAERFRATFRRYESGDHTRHYNGTY